jgi:hypothetical protein
LEYEIDGEVKVIEDTMIFDYDGWRRGDEGNIRVWKSTYASGAERIVLLEVEEPVDVGRKAQMTKQLVCYATGYGTFFMEAPHTQTIDDLYRGQYAYVYIEYEDGLIEERQCYTPQLLDDFKITVLSLEAAVPINSLD